MLEPPRYAVAAGVVGPVVGFGAKLVATVAYLTFSWSGSALSDLGASGAANPWLFNLGIELSALLRAGFAWVLWTQAES